MNKAVLVRGLTELQANQLIKPIADHSTAGSSNREKVELVTYEVKPGTNMSNRARDENSAIAMLDKRIGKVGLTKLYMIHLNM